MSGTFVVRTTPHYERLARDLAQNHAEFLTRIRYRAVRFPLAALSRSSAWD